MRSSWKLSWSKLWWNTKKLQDLSQMKPTYSETAPVPSSNSPIARLTLSTECSKESWKYHYLPRTLSWVSDGLPREPIRSSSGNAHSFCRLKDTTWDSREWISNWWKTGKESSWRKTASNISQEPIHNQFCITNISSPAWDISIATWQFLQLTPSPSCTTTSKTSSKTTHVSLRICLHITPWSSKSNKKNQNTYLFEHLLSFGWNFFTYRIIINI